MGVGKLTLSKARSHNYIKQVKSSALFKVGAIGATFLAMPIMIKYLGVEQFGIWSTMLTLITWVMLFDLGIGNGLKNKVSESLAQDSPDQAASYISTAYGLIGFIAFGLFSLFLILSFWLPWQSIFNSQAISEENLRNAVITLSFFIFFNFWISLINQIYHGLQKSSIVVLGQFISNTLALFLVFLLYQFTQSSINFMVWAYGGALVTANLALSLFLFKSHWKLMPTLQGFDKNKISSLLSLGIQFFIIQFAVLVIFMTDKILIAQLLGPEHVTTYEVLFKLFSVFTIIHSLLLTPLWPAYSDAYQRGDLDWIHSSIKKQIKVAFVLFVGAFFLATIGPMIVKIWIGGQVIASSMLFYLFAIFIVFSVWSNVFAYFVNATNQLNVQLYTSIFAALINIPLSLYFVRVLELGLNGIILATIVSLSIFALLGPIQVFRIIRAGKI
jgi:O-antigen/teichoic acid export membrane protein